MNEHLSEIHLSHMRRAIELALRSETEGNLPVGAVIVYDAKIIAEGRNRIWVPTLNPNRHAEIEALRATPVEYWKHAADLTLYTTLEPCLMCFGAILLHSVGQVVYGTADPYGGTTISSNHLPPYFQQKWSQGRWIGPALPSECDPLYQRLLEMVDRA